MDSLSINDRWIEGTGWNQVKREFRSLIDVDLIYTSSFEDFPEFSRSIHLVVSRIQTTLANRAKTSPGMSNVMLSLISDGDTLAENLVKDKNTLSSLGKLDVPEQIVFKTFFQFLENARRDLQPGSSHRRKVWERLKTTAVECEQIYFSQRPGISWLDTNFLISLLELIQQKYPSDKNLPRTLVGLEAYIYEYSGHHIELDSEEIEHMIDDNWCSKSGLSHQEALEECLNQLAVSQPDWFEALDVKFSLGRVGYLRVQDFLDEKTLSRRLYQRQVSSALDSLETCITEKIG